jgi:Reverse transcriptase (RNA-dependent DNA polymerase)
MISPFPAPSGAFTESIAFWNADGLKHKYETLENAADLAHFDQAAILETHYKPDVPAPQNIVINSPSPARSGPGSPKHGVAWYSKTPNHHTYRILREHAGTVVWFVLDDRLLICVAYLPPTAEPAEICEWLQPPADHDSLPIILLGDLNMRLGAESNDGHNPRGTWLPPLLSMMGLHRIPHSGNGATFLSSRGGRSIVDHLYTNINKKDIKLELSDAPRGGSDHFFLIARFNESALAARPPTASVVGSSRLRLWKLRPAEFHDSVKGELTSIFQQYEPFQDRMDLADPECLEIINSLDSAVTHVLLSAAEEMCGRTDPSKRRKVLKPPNVREAIRVARRIDRKVSRMNARGTAVPRPLLSELQKAHAAKTIAVAKWRDESWKSFVDDLAHSNYSDAIKRLASISRSRRRVRFPLSVSESAMSTYADRFERPFTQQEWQPSPVPFTVSSPRNPSFAIPKSCVWRVLRRLARIKSPGASGLPNALLRDAPEDGILTTVLALLFTLCGRWSVVPSSWQTALIVPVPKKGDLSSIENYRPISLTETLRKVFERCLLPTLVHDAGLRRSLDIAQGGFREGRGTIDSVAAFAEARAHRQRSLQRPPVLMFLDITAAYDSVDLSRLWTVLRDEGMHESYICLLRQLFGFCSSRVTIQGVLSRLITHQRGLLQGSILSPFLYSWFIDALLRSLRSHARFSMGGVQTSVFAYADDLALVADDLEHAQQLLSVCEAHAEANGYRFSAKKSEVIALPELDTSCLQLHGQALTRALTFVYLGVSFDLWGVAWRKHAERLVSKAEKTVAMATLAGMYARGIGVLLAVRMYCALVRPQLEYGLQLSTLTKAAKGILQRSQHQLLCRLLCLPRSTCAAALAHVTGVPLIADRQIELMARATARRYRIAESEEYMISAALREMVTHGPQPGSCLILPNDALTLADALLQPSRTETWADTVKRHRLGVFAARKDRVRPTALLANEPQLNLRQIAVVPSIPLQRILLRALLNRVVGQPAACRACPPGVKAGPTHLRLCANEPFDEYVAEGNLLRGAVSLARALSRCTSFNCAYILRAVTEMRLYPWGLLKDTTRRLKAQLSPDQFARQRVREIGESLVVSSLPPPHQ